MARKTNFIASNNKEYYRTSLHLGNDVDTKSYNKYFMAKHVKRRCGKSKFL